MTPTLATRLRRLLDVLQQCHGLKRSAAARLIADECGVSYRWILENASENHGVVHPLRSRLTGVDLRALELRYADQLSALVAYEAECARYLERLERVA